MATHQESTITRKRIENAVCFIALIDVKLIVLFPITDLRTIQVAIGMIKRM